MSLAKSIIAKILEITGLGTLPSEGFLAGGAVTAAVLSLSDSRNYKINDVDVFIEKSLSMSESHRMNTEAEMIGSGYGFQCIDRTYSLAMTGRDGLLNTIAVDMEDNLDKNKEILLGFDINACCAGVDLKTMEYLSLPCFDEFVKTRQMKVFRPFTPSRTAIRLVRKSIELGCFIDLDEELAALATYHDLNAWYMQYNQPIRDKVLHQFYQYAGTLQKYCRVVPNPEKTGEYDLLFNCSRKLELETIFPGANSFSPAVYMQVWDTVMRKGTSRAVKDRYIDVVKTGTYSLYFATKDPSVYAHGASPKKVKRIEEFLNEHRYFNPLLLGDNLDVRYKSVQMLENCKNGLIAVGLLETGNLTTPPSPITREWIDAKVSEYLENNKDQLTKPFAYPNIRGAKVRELVTVADLCIEGALQHHCVGGYAEEVKRGSSRIFHIDFNAEPSTIEICYDRITGHPSICQHRGKYNARPSDASLAIGKKLARRIKLMWFCEKTLHGEFRLLTRPLIIGLERCACRLQNLLANTRRYLDGDKDSFNGQIPF